MKMKKLPQGLARKMIAVRRMRRAAAMRTAGVAFGIALCSFLWVVAAHAGERTVKSLLEMRRENVVIQKWDLSCGAAALATLLRYQHGEDVSEREVALALMNREEYIRNPQLVQTREGFSLLDLKRHVDARGYVGNGFGKLKMKDLVAKAPLIVPIQTNGYNHFVVFRGLQGDRVLLADPAWGNRTMRVEEFAERWIDYPSLGHIGFAVQRRDGSLPPNQLEPTRDDFVSLR
ncbi:C39 family peptidase [Noviherbaspirillum sp.]|uniref:C39 family peptidase n=1 Tax=Noviherbaspirillum sp. TaxID=1926288 RepID=UPI002B4929DF|nr:C39 family peptidase [Noviherbaspirillum sp.]HJV83272.1 C39 family peptidase [Noviherbaspirillum sp.]